MYLQMFSRSRSDRQPTAGGDVLRVVDRSFLLAIPVLVLCVAIPHPAVAWIWVLVGVGVGAALGACVWLGGETLARWRGAVYTIVTLAAAIATLWTIGPITGVGAMYGLAILVAGALLSRGWLVVVAITAIGSIAVRLLVGGATRFEQARNGRFELPLTVWVFTALAIGVIVFIALRVMTVLIASLERAYATAAEAYRAELETREELDGSRQQLEELAQVEMVGRLAGGVAHDVNNALAVILATSDVLAAEVSTPDQRRHLTELESASHHAADLVRDLLWTGRRFPAPSSSVAGLGATTRVCVERVGRVARKIAVEVRIDQSTQVAVSPEHLEQILFGLIVGAGRAGVRHVQLSSRPVGDLIEISLAGTGIDDSPTARTRVMQVELSVSAARELVGQYGGTLTLEELAGELRIVVCVPMAPGPREVELVAAAPMRTALVVEDEPMVLRRLCKLVARRGYEVSAASTVAEAMALLAASPDLLITDLQLPDGSGETIALASFAQDPTRTIIVCSGFNADDIRRGPLRQATLVVLAKPFTSADFEAAVPIPHAPPVPAVSQPCSA